jgi:hypothetical protein
MSTATLTTARSRVLAGAAWLDQHRPGWWKSDRFDLGNFSLSDGCRCVVGQIYITEIDGFDDRDTDSAFDEAITDAWLDLTFELATDLGFYAGPPLQYSDEYAELDREWRRLIEERREKTLEGAS